MSPFVKNISETIIPMCRLWYNMRMPIIVPVIVAAIASVAELRKAVWSDGCAGDAFSVTCTVSAVTRVEDRMCAYWITDGANYGYVRTTNNVCPVAGERIVAHGHVGADKFGWTRAFVESAERLGIGELPVPVSATPEQLNDETFDGRTVVMRGIVTDIVRDEIDPGWRFLLMRTEAGPFFAAVSAAENASLDHLIGATVSAKGIANVLPDGAKRKFQTPQLSVPDIADITVVAPADNDPRHATPIPDNSQQSMENVRYKSVAALSRMGMRSVEGWVLAVLDHGAEILVKAKSGQVFGAALRHAPAPSYGERVIVAGFPETDLFMIKLTKAIWENAPGSAMQEEEIANLPTDFAMENVLRDLCAKGRIVRIAGMVVDEDAPSFSVLVGRHVVKVDASVIAESTAVPQIGSEVEIVGACVRNTSASASRTLFPRTEGFTLVPRSPSDVRILRSPPWWTPAKLLVVVSALALALLGTFAWNRILRRIVERRSRQLFKAEIAKAESDLRVDERTRLAAEIHDAISQTLTGVSFQVDAAEKTLPTDTNAAARFLSVARSTLLSCREDLRRCIWDLRNDTLASPDFAEAIRRTVRPCVGTTEVIVTFNVKRTHLTDSTAHAVLSIVRELAVNAVRHGKARRILISGKQQNETIIFSVRDDGCGFDPSSHPGPAQGHFGLQGIKERVAKMRGRVMIESAPGSGTTITVEIGK